MLILGDGTLGNQDRRYVFTGFDGQYMGETKLVRDSACTVSERKYTFYYSTVSIHKLSAFCLFTLHC